MSVAERSPLAEIERTVQHRAKEASIDVKRPEGLAQLEALISDEVIVGQTQIPEGGPEFY